jgi:hypothetical protein
VAEWSSSTVSAIRQRRYDARTASRSWPGRRRIESAKVRDTLGRIAWQNATDSRGAGDGGTVVARGGRGAAGAEEDTKFKIATCRCEHDRTRRT